jgi:hypothetical protein
MSRPGFLMIASLVMLAASGCSRGLASPTLPAVPNLDLPDPVPPRAALPPDLATMVYPESDRNQRDPFLTVAEQVLVDDRKDLAPKSTIIAASGPIKHAALLPYQRVISQMHDQVHGIILGAPNVFMFKGHGYEEGDVIDGTDWVVLSVQETGIKLRSKDGSGSDYLPFKTDASINFEFTTEQKTDKGGAP